MRQLTIIVGCFLFSILNSNGQNNQQIEIADSLYSLSKDLLKINLLDSSEILCLKSNKTYFESKAWDKWMNSINRIGEIYLRKDSIQKFVGKLNGYKEVIPHDSIKTSILFDITHAYYLSRLTLYIEEIELYKSILKRLSITNDTFNTQKVYYNCSIAYSRLGDQKNAIDYLTKAINLLSGETFEARYCWYSSVLGKYYFHDSNFQEAEYIYLKGLQKCPEYNSFYYYLSELYLASGKEEKAKHFLDLSRESFGEIAADYFINLSEYYRKVNKEVLAVEAHIKGLNILSNSLNRRSYTKELVRIAQMHNYFGNDLESSSYAHMALETAIPRIDSFLHKGLLEVENFPTEIWLVDALYLKSKYYFTLYKSLENSDIYIDSLNLHLSCLFDLFENVKSTHNSNSSSYLMSYNHAPKYAAGINFYLDIYNSQQNEEFKEYAFQLAQESNAYVLKNAFSMRESLQFAGVPSDTINKHLFLHGQVSNDKTDTIDRLDKLQEYDAYKDYLSNTYPGWTNYQNKETPTIAQLQSKLEDDQLLIKYFYHDNDLKAFAINKNTSLTYDLELPENFDSLVNRNLELLAQSGTNNSVKETEQAFIESSSQLYNLILKDILSSEEFKGIQHLIIVPDGPIKKISFSSLINKPTSNWEDISKYLVSDYQISYLYYCAQLLNELQKEDKEGFLGFGIEYEDSYLQQLMEELRANYGEDDSSRSFSLASLAYADEEAKTCAELYDGQYFINQDVTPSQVKNQIEKFDMVHFSLHALVDEENYLDSYMLLNPDTSSNKISYRDILSLNSQPSFVVLSACQTGTGSDIVGEGSMSLCRAFSQTGTDATMGSYWNTPDKSTMQIMKLFYTNLKEGMNKSEALRQAQIEYATNDALSSPIVRRPVNWASWVIYGSVEPVGGGSWTNNVPMVLLLTGLLILIVFMYRNYGKELN